MGKRTTQLQKAGPKTAIKKAEISTNKLSFEEDVVKFANACCQELDRDIAASNFTHLTRADIGIKSWYSEVHYLDGPHYTWQLWRALHPEGWNMLVAVYKRYLKKRALEGIEKVAESPKTTLVPLTPPVIVPSISELLKDSS